MENEKRLIDANATADAIAEVMDKYGINKLTDIIGGTK